MMDWLERQAAQGRWLATLVAGLVAATAISIILGRLFHASTATVWAYLPLVLVVTLHSGRIPGLLLGLAADLLVLTLVIPLGTPHAEDPHAYARLFFAIAGTTAAVLIVDSLNRRRIADERRGRVEAELLAELGWRISASLNLNEVLQQAVEAAQTLLSTDVVAISLLGAGKSQPAALVGDRSPLLMTLAPPSDVGVTQQIMESGQPIQVHWSEAHLRFSPHPDVLQAMEAEGIRTTLAAPIRGQGEMVGLFWIHSRRLRDFTPEEVARLERLAAQAGAAIVNADAHAEEQRARAEEREARAEVQALLLATTSLGMQAEPESVLRTLVEQAARLLDAERATYAVWRDGRVLIPYVWLKGRWLDERHDVPSGGIAQLVWETGQPYRTNQLDADPYANAEAAKRLQLRSQLTVPLLGPDGERLGLVSVNNSRRPESFTARDERLLVAICETGASVLRRARDTAARLEAEHTAAQRQREVEALLAAADQLHSVGRTEEVLQRVVSIGVELLNVRRAGIATNEGTYAARRHTLVDGAWGIEERRMDLDASVAGWVIQHGQPFRTETFAEAAQLQNPVSAAGPPTTALAVPIFAHDGSVFGTLQLFDRRDGRPFSDADERLAEGIAHHAAVALERAALVDELRRHEMHLRQQAVTDPLTGLPNRTLFFERLSAALATPSRPTGLAVLFLDLDGFKLINDSLGHATGDRLLALVAERLVSSLPEPQTVARLGGDEFAVLVQNLPDAQDELWLANRILHDFARPFTVDARNVFIGASIGICTGLEPDGTDLAEEVLRRADIALYHAKADGKGRAIVFTPSMGTEAIRRLDLQTGLQNAASEEQLRLYYQPIVALADGRVVGTEALVRWQRPGQPLLEPDSFVPLAEETGLILPIGRWVLDEACRQAKAWQGIRGATPYVSVNLSARQFEQRDLARQVRTVLRAWDLKPSILQLEITETAIIANPEAASRTLKELRELGVHIAIDDFGSGYSSLSSLQRLPVDRLKLDRPFVQELQQGDTGAAVAQAIISMAHALSIEVTAEGIETEEQRTVLTALSCDSGQGYYFSRPVAAEVLTELLQEAHWQAVAAGTA
jgi:diguanylate cyclase (GGDEF)-like protein